jgi:hypothetical protein
MDQSKSRIKLFIIIVAVVCFTIIMYLFIYNHVIFRVTGTNPSINSVSSVAPFFKINFTQPLSGDNLSLNVSDPSIIRRQAISNKTLILTLNQLQIDKHYTVTINSITSKSGKTITNQSFHFTTKSITYNELPKDQQQGIINNQSYSTNGQNDPILKYLPASSLHYTISAQFSNDSTTKNNLVLATQILLSQADLGPGEDNTIKSYEQEAADYVKSLGFDVSKYDFKFMVIRPS